MEPTTPFHKFTIMLCLMLTVQTAMAQDDNISLMTFVTPDAVTKLGGPNATAAAILKAVQDLNVALKTSGINGEVKPIALLSHADPNMCKQDFLNKLLTADISLNGLRNTYQADVVMFVVDDDASCGISGARVDRYSAFIIVHYACMAANYSVARQFGYLLGAGNDTSIDGWAPPATPNARAYTYLNDDGDQEFTTIMGYSDNRNASLLPDFSLCPVYSNLVYQYNGKPTGDATHNNAAVMNSNFAVVANYNVEALSYIVYAQHLKNQEQLRLHGNESIEFSDFEAEAGSETDLDVPRVKFNSGTRFLKDSRARKRQKRE